jgi:hypothetical protein
LLACGLLLAGAGGCASSGSHGTGASSSPKNAPDPNVDPCALHLHDDLCPALLTYYATNFRMPGLLEELNRLPGREKLDFTCPGSGKVYGYNRDGLGLPDRNGRLLVYDSTPAHHGYRWAIEVVAGEGQMPFMNVVPIAEDKFQEALAKNK